MTQIDPAFLNDPNLPTVGAGKTFKYVKAIDENGKEYWMPCTAAILLGDEAVGVIIRVIRAEVEMIVRDQVTQIVQRALDIRFPQKPGSPVLDPDR